jgi:lysophospholipase L1-like esterase
MTAYRRRARQLAFVSTVLLVAAMPTAVAGPGVPSGTVTTFAGIGNESGPAEGAATKVRLPAPGDIAVDGAGSTYVALASTVRKISPTGTVTVFAGGGASTADGVPARQADLGPISGLAIDRRGDVYVSEWRRVLRISASTGRISTMTGTEVAGFAGDGGPGRLARFDGIQDIDVDAHGDVYIADSGNGRVRKLDAATEVITTVAGAGRAAGIGTGNGGPATAAGLGSIYSIAVNSRGDLYIGGYQVTIRKVTHTTGTITNVVGKTPFDDDERADTPAENFALTQPARMLVDGADGVLIAQGFTRHQVVRLDPSNRQVDVIAGQGPAGYSGDGGPALAAHFYDIGGLAIDRSGNLLVSDTLNSRIRVIQAGGVSPAPAPSAPVTPPPVAAKPDRYVALGDSYASGEGATEETFDPRTTMPDPQHRGATIGCHRSTTAWSSDVADRAAEHGLTDPRFVACSGATIDDLYSPNTQWQSAGEYEPAQLDSVTAQTTGLVTLSIGGNDVGFEKVLKTAPNRSSRSWALQGSVVGKRDASPVGLPPPASRPWTTGSPSNGPEAGRTSPRSTTTWPAGSPPAAPSSWPATRDSSPNPDGATG